MKIIKESSLHIEGSDIKFDEYQLYCYNFKPVACQYKVEFTGVILAKEGEGKGLFTKLLDDWMLSHSRGIDVVFFRHVPELKAGDPDLSIDRDIPTEPDDGSEHVPTGFYREFGSNTHRPVEEDTYVYPCEEPWGKYLPNEWTDEDTEELNGKMKEYVEKGIIVPDGLEGILDESGS